MSEFTMMTQQHHWIFAYGVFTLASVFIGAFTYLVIDRWLQH
jgi:hypothetical protein